MSSSYNLYNKNGITFIELFKNLGESGAQALIDKIADEFPCDKRLWDLTQLEDDFSTDDLRFYGRYGKARFNQPSKLALVAGSDLLFGEMREYLGLRGDDQNTQVMVFRNRQEAEIWLQLD